MDINKQMEIENEGISLDLEKVIGYENDNKIIDILLSNIAKLEIDNFN